MPIYQNIYNLIVTYLFGAVQVGTYQELVSILLASIFSIAVILLPLYIVHSFMRLFTRF